MALGPGKYQHYATPIREQEDAEGVILVVIGGRLGSSFCCQTTPELTQRLPALLRHMADQIEADHRRGQM